MRGCTFLRPRSFLDNTGETIASIKYVRKETIRLPCNISAFHCTPVTRTATGEEVLGFFSRSYPWRSAYWFWDEHVIGSASDLSIYASRSMTV